MGGRGASSGRKSGGISYDKELNTHDHKVEISMAYWLHANFGGNIQVLQEINADKQKTSDYLWNGKYWNLKTISSEKAADYAIRHGVKQIKEKPGGLILDYVGETLDKSKLMKIMDSRVRRHPENHIRIIVVRRGKLIIDKEYKKR